MSATSTLRLLVRLLFAIALIMSWRAGAHPQFALSTINRYTKLILVREDAVRLTYVLMVGDAPALELRRQADRNGDGRLDEAEGAALAQKLAVQAKQGLRLRVDGQPATMEFLAPVLGLAGDAVAPSAFSVDLNASVEVLPGQEHEVQFEDCVSLGPVGEVEYLIEESPGVKLRESHQGRATPSSSLAETRYRFYGPPTSLLTDRSITVRFQPIKKPLPWRWLASLGGAGVVTAMLCIALGQRRRRV